MTEGEGTFPPNAHSAETGSRPAVSVIILAHDRRQYLRSAIESVLRQDLDPAAREIVVVKNYLDPDLDDFAARAGARTILCTAVPAAAKVAAAFRVSRGRIVCILDDDDILEPGRLTQVVRAFDQYPDLGFYRNLFTYIDDRGGPLTRGTVPLLGLRSNSRTPRLLIDDAHKSADVSHLAFMYPDFNASSSAMRREVLDNVLPDLERIRLAVDTLVFFEALCSPWSLLLDDQYLTRYRIHSDNTSLAGAGTPGDRMARLADFARITLQDYDIIRERVARSGRPFALKQIDARILVNRISLASRTPSSTRREFGALLVQVPRYANTFPLRESSRTVGGAVVFLLSPSLGRTLYQSQMSVR